jgi:uncharacterized membrane protein
VIGVTTLAVVDKSMPSLTGVAGMANQTMYSATYSAFNALNLGSIIVIVLVAAVINALIVGAFRFFALSGAAE